MIWEVIGKTVPLQSDVDEVHSQRELLFGEQSILVIIGKAPHFGESSVGQFRFQHFLE